MAEGYEAFVSCNRSAKGRGAYSGILLWFYHNLELTNLVSLHPAVAYLTPWSEMLYCSLWLSSHHVLNQLVTVLGSFVGVATFCRVTSAFSSQEIALPVAAEEGFTGLQDYAKNSEIVGDFVIATPVAEEGLGEITREDLLRVDNEGRCIITDHGHFGK
jgi:hypothetical protein